MFFYNENFRRDNKSLLNNMRSVTAAGRRRQEAKRQQNHQMQSGTATGSHHGEASSAPSAKPAPQIKHSVYCDGVVSREGVSTLSARNPAPCSTEQSSLLLRQLSAFPPAPREAGPPSQAAATGVKPMQARSGDGGSAPGFDNTSPLQSALLSQLLQSGSGGQSQAQLIGQIGY